MLILRRIRRLFRTAPQAESFPYMAGCCPRCWPYLCKPGVHLGR